jgi:hypothetical protein
VVGMDPIVGQRRAARIVGTPQSAPKSLAAHR